MGAPTSEASAVLRAFRTNRAATIGAGVHSMFRLLDALPAGLKTGVIMEQTGHTRAATFGGCQALESEGCLTSAILDRKVGTSSRLWTGTPKLEVVAGCYNDLVATIISPEISEIAGRRLDGRAIRTLALGRLATSLRINVPPTDETALFQAMPERLGHPHSVVNRALLSLAEVEGVDQFVRNGILAAGK
ncbi:MAG TPA: hypothetical protein VD735_03560 [Candidatus Saccharimonadales bacterium]|nr:hypothetical protein [Candidatus Saccharimonadales bacterium]